jgi:hypothetical protein
MTEGSRSRGTPTTRRRTGNIDAKRDQEDLNGDIAFASALKAVMADKKMSGPKLASAVRDVDSTIKGLGEKGIDQLLHARKTVSLNQIRVLARALCVTPETLVFEYPFQLFRALTATKAYKFLPSSRPDDPHAAMKDVYSYVSLDMNAALPDDVSAGAGRRASQAVWPSVSQLFLFKATYCPLELVVRGLAVHEGEEVLQVRSGALEWWYRDDLGGSPQRKLLHAGDILHYSSRMPHAYRAVRMENTLTGNEQDEYGPMATEDAMAREHSRHPIEAMAAFVYVWRGEPHIPLHQMSYSKNRVKVRQGH